MSLRRNKNRDSLSQCVFDCGQVTLKIMLFEKKNDDINDTIITITIITITMIMKMIITVIMMMMTKQQKIIVQ